MFSPQRVYFLCIFIFIPIFRLDHTRLGSICFFRRGSIPERVTFYHTFLYLFSDEHNRLGSICFLYTLQSGVLKSENKYNNDNKNKLAHLGIDSQWTKNIYFPIWCARLKSRIKNDNKTYPRHELNPRGFFRWGSIPGEALFFFSFFNTYFGVLSTSQKVIIYWKSLT